MREIWRPKLTGGLEVAAAAVGVRQRLLLLLVGASEMSALQRTSPQGLTAAGPYIPFVSVIRAGQESLQELDALALPFPLIEQSSDGRTIIAASRCNVTESRAEASGAIFSVDGQMEAEFVIGDAVCDLLATTRGFFWASYFDEGIFGDGPISKDGLACFDMDLNGGQVWGFSRSQQGRFMDDCYAITAHETDKDINVWAYYYSAFELARITYPGFHVAIWKTPVEGAGAIAAWEQRVAFFGSYDDRDTSRYQLFDIDGDQLRPRGVRRLVMPDGSPVQTEIMTRDGGAFTFASGAWFGVSHDQLLGD